MKPIIANKKDSGWPETKHLKARAKRKLDKKTKRKIEQYVSDSFEVRNHMEDILNEMHGC